MPSQQHLRAMRGEALMPPPTSTDVHRAGTAFPDGCTCTPVSHASGMQVAMRGRRPLDLAGQRFGRLTAISYTRHQSGRVTAWLCKCDCGADVVVATRELSAGDTRSCGCLKRHVTSVRMTTHGHTVDGKSPTYQSWRAMRMRCMDASSEFFHCYGGRGIAICERWLAFENFLADMGERPAGTTLDRRDTNGNYEPSNCRWATSAEQARNTRRTRLTEDLVREIHGRFEHGERKVSIARRFAMSRSVIGNIIAGRAWGDIYAEGTCLG